MLLCNYIDGDVEILEGERFIPGNNFLCFLAPLPCAVQEHCLLLTCLLPAFPDLKEIHSDI